MHGGRSCLPEPSLKISRPGLGWQVGGEQHPPPWGAGTRASSSTPAPPHHVSWVLAVGTGAGGLAPELSFLPVPTKNRNSGTQLILSDSVGGAACANTAHPPGPLPLTSAMAAAGRDPALGSGTCYFLPGLSTHFCWSLTSSRGPIKAAAPRIERPNAPLFTPTLHRAGETRLAAQRSSWMPCS